MSSPKSLRSAVLYAFLLWLPVGIPASYLFLLEYWVSSLMVQSPTSNSKLDTECSRFDQTVRPLLIGQSLFLDEYFTACPNRLSAEKSADYTWSTPDSQVVRLSADGHMTAIAPGQFTAVAIKNDTSRRITGFVLPPGYQVRLEPAEVTLHVGELVRVSARAFDENGSPLPATPFAIEAAVSAGQASSIRPLYQYGNEYSFQPIPLVAVAQGKSTVVARIGSETAEVEVIVMNAEPVGAR